MRGYRTSAGSETRLDYGLELLAGLQLFPETAPLVPDFAIVNSGLEAAHGERLAQRPLLVKARVALRLANYEADQTIRSCSKAAEIADGGRRGPVFDALFPQGVGPVVRPVGSRQIQPTEELLDRLTKSRSAVVKAFAQEWKPKLQAALDKLMAAAQAHKAALGGHADRFRDEVALRQQHKQSIDRLMGQVRAAFPGDRVKQDLVFPEVDAAGRVAVADGAAGEGDVQEAPSAPDAPSPAAPA